jgi:hypothetical protein
VTTYVSDTPTPGTLQAPGRAGWFMWADTVDEAVIMAASVGHDPNDLIQRSPSHWAHYLLTVDEWADAITLGATLTDRLGPAEWMNRRDGNWAFVAQIQELRKRNG